MSLRDALNKASTVDPFAGFLPVDGDTSTGTEYYAFMAMNGAWIIKTWTPLTGQARFFGGASGYAAAWADRVNLTYTYPDGTP